MLNELIKKRQNGEVSSLELVDSYIEKIKKEDDDLNSYLYLNTENAREAAKKIDANSKNCPTPLSGIPYAVKDNILAKDMPCTAGSRMLENYIASYDATIVSKLNDEGAIILGKNNMDEFAMGSSTENSAFGSTKNPMDTTRVPGGSSGGSAASVAAGLAPFAIASDTGGSIRQPAAFCGVVGFKPTYGAVSRYGLMAMASSLDQIGTITNTVEDAKTVFPYMTGLDGKDSTSQKINTDNSKKHKSLKGLRVGVIKEFIEDIPDPRIKEKVIEATNVYKDMGAEIHEISLPYAPYSLAVYYVVMPSEVSSNLERYDGIRYGRHLAEEGEEALDEAYKQIRGEGFGKEALRRIVLGTYTLSAGYYDAYYLKAQKVRTLIAQDFSDAFKKVDVIFSPTTPTIPFKIGEKIDDPLAMYLSDMYTVGANLAGLPAISIPVGNVKEEGVDISVGMQIIGPAKKDLMVLDVAEHYEKSNK